MRTGLAVLILLCCASATFAQGTGTSTAPLTAEELAAQTALLKAQQAYYDQLITTLKSQAALATLDSVNATASVKAQADLQTAQMTKDLALANALKGAGLTAPTGKVGNMTFTAGTATFLPLQQASLVALDTLADKICEALKTKDVKNAFFGPANFELLVQKGTVDVLQFSSLHQVAGAGNEDLSGVKLEVAGTGIAGAVLTAEYLAGGIESLTKLFRSDYAVTLTTNNRPNLLEQRLAVKCEAGRLVANTEGILRMNAAKVLAAWLPDMAEFVQRYETLNEQAMVQMTTLTADRTATAADSGIPADEKRKRLEQLRTDIAAKAAQQAQIAKWKSASTVVKTFISGLSSTSPLFDSLVWAQDLLFEKGGVPQALVNPNLNTRPRLTATVNVQDATVTKSSTFSSSQVKGVSTVEAYFAVTDPKGILLSGVYSHTAETPALNFKATSQPSYESVFPPSPPQQNAGGGSPKNVTR